MTNLEWLRSLEPEELYRVIDTGDEPFHCKFIPPDLCDYLDSCPHCFLTWCMWEHKDE